MINSVTLAGNLTRDIELRSTANGYTIGYLSIAVNDRRKSKATGEWEDVPYFFDAKLLGTRAEKLAGALTKGAHIVIQGKLEQERWDDKETGAKRSRNYIVIDELSLGAKRDSGVQPAAPEAIDDTADLYGEEVPF